MKFENVKSDGMSYEYKVVFSADEIEKHIVTAVEKKAKTFKMQGFRPGHVPLNIVRTNVESSVLKGVLESLVDDACKKISEDSKVRNLASRPVYRFESPYEKGKDVNLTLTIEIMPTFDLQPYNFEVTKVVPKVEEKDINDALSQLMITSPVYEKAKDGYAIKAKDEVTYRAVCYNKGVESKKKSFGNNLIIPDVIPEGSEFLENFIGKKVGDSFDFVPATDKGLKYKVSVKSIKEALTKISMDEFAKRLGFKDTEELKSAMKERMEHDINSKAFTYHKNQILEALSKAYDFPLPKGIVEKEMRIVIGNVKREQERAKKSGDTLEKELTDDEIRKEYASVVEKRVLLGYVMNKIAQEEKISASEDEIRNAIIAEVNNNRGNAQAIIDYYSNNQDAVAYKKAELIEQKVILHILSKVKTKEVAKNAKEIEKIVEDLFKDEK